MTPNERGVFCGSCQKNVLDFTSKSIEEIKQFFTEKPAEEEVCARFHEQQLRELDLDAFLSEFMSWKWIQRAAVICFLVIGSSLVQSCAPKVYTPMLGDVQVEDPKRLNDTLQTITGEAEVLKGDTVALPQVIPPTVLGTVAPSPVNGKVKAVNRNKPN